jgi:phospholipase C
MLMSGPNAFAASVQPYKHLVVIYQENHSFDNLYGMWGDVNGTPVNGLSNTVADHAHTWQVRQDNTVYQCLLQNDVNLTSPNPLPTTCVDTTAPSAPFNSAFLNAPFFIDQYNTSETGGSNHLVDLIKAVVEGPNAKDTLIIVTYDEFGGQWGHVPVPAVDQWGPGTRIATLLVSAKFAQSGVDHAMHETTSILKLIEEKFRLAPLSTHDANTNTLTTALDIANP